MSHRDDRSGQLSQEQIDLARLLRVIGEGQYRACCGNEHQVARRNTFIKAAEEIERLTSALSAKWISVENRVPGDDTTMIVHTHTGVTAVGFWDGLGWYEPECHSFVSMGENVTHWMPFPEPPK